ncbi:MAG: metal-sensing transcriptional repressor [Lawsonella sp.]
MRADPKWVLHKLKIARGQLEGIIKMVQDDKYCVDISNQILATNALLKRVNHEILQEHIRGCVADALATDEPNEKVEEALALLKKLA